MDDFAAPAGPPPPKAPEVPAGWTARWNDQYKEWFYVNVYTKKSQWDKPTAPVFPVDENSPDGPPPGYEPGNGPVPTDTKKNPYEDQHNHQQNYAAGSSSTADDDARLAAQLQAEEDTRARGGPQPPVGYGGANSPFPQQQNNSSYPAELPPRERGGKSGGFLGKLLSKAKQSSSGQHGGSHGGYGGYPQQQQFAGGGGGYPGHGPPMGYGAQPHYGQPHYGQPQYGQPMGGMGYGGGGGHYPPQRRAGGGGGMGMAGGAALGMGAGMLGGYMMADAMNDGEQDAYQDGYEDGAGGDDFGGGDE